MPVQQLIIEIIGHSFPFRRSANADIKVLSTPETIYVGVQKGSASKSVIEQRAPGDASRAGFRAVFTVTKKGKTYDFKGPYTQGKTGERFFYLSWFRMGTGTPEMFRRLKIPLHTLSTKSIEQALKSGEPISAKLTMTGEDGTPLCGTAKEPQLKWE